MKWLRRLVLFLSAAAVLAVLALLGPLRAPATARLRTWLEQALTVGLEGPVSIGALRITLWPPGAEADDVVLGADGAFARAAHLSVHLRPRTSLRQRRPVADATVTDAQVDVPRWVHRFAPPPGTPPTALPAFRLRALRLTNVRARLSEDEEPLDLAVGSASGALTAAQGRLAFAVDAHTVELARRGAVVRLQRARARGGESDIGWRLTAVEGDGDGIEIRSRPTVADRLPIRARLPLRDLAFADALFERLGGDAEFDGTLIGPLDEPAAAGRMRASGLAIDGEALGDVEAAAEWSLDRLAVSSARLVNVAGEAEASGELVLRAPFACTARARWSSLDVRGLLHLNEQVMKAMTASGSAELSGTLQPLAVRASGSGDFTPTAGGAPLAWTGEGTYGDGAATGAVEASQARVNTLRANLEVGAGGALAGAVDAAVADPTALGALLPIASLPTVNGSLTLAARLAGTVADPRLEGQLAGRDVALLGVSLDRLEGTIAADRRALHTPGLTAVFWQGKVVLAGAIALDAGGDNDWRLAIDDVPGEVVVALVDGITGTLPPIGRGTLNATLSARGPWPRVQLTAGATMEHFWLTQQWIEHARLNASAAWPEWQLEAAVRNLSGDEVLMDGRGRAAADVTLTAHSAGWALTALQRGTASESGGRFTLDASVGGPLGALSGQVALQARNLALAGRSVGAVEVSAEATRGRWQVRASALDGVVRLSGSLAPDVGWPFSVDGEWQEARLGHVLLPESEVRIVTTGTLHAAGRLMAADQVDGVLQLTTLRISNGPFELAAAQPVVLTCRRGACTLDRMELSGSNTTLGASGGFGLGGEVRLAVHGNGELRLLELLGRPIESARGRFVADADVQRRAARWEVSGELRIDEAAFDLGAPVAVTRASARILLDGSAIRIDSFAGRMGTGRFTIGGEVDLARGPQISWTLTDVGAVLIPSLEAEVSGHGTCAGTWQRLRLAGELTVTRMLYDRNIELTDFLPSFNRALAAAPRPPSERKLELDLHVGAPGELYVENNIARIEARADLRLTGTTDHPVLSGRVEALDGQVTFRDRVFEIEGATVDFRPDLGLAAALNISAESTIDTPDATYIVGVRVTGTTQDPRVTLSSDDPGLSQTDLATLITVGETSAQLREGGGGFSFYDALTMVPKPITEGIQKGATTLLPIDRITFEPTFSRTSGTFQPTLKLGKDLSDSLAVSVGQTFGVESRTLAEADYRLSPRVFVPVSWESQTSTQAGAFQAGVKLRYEFWRATPYTLIGGSLR